MTGSSFYFTAAIDSVAVAINVEAKSRYGYIERLLCDAVPPPARIVELGSAPGDQISHLASLGYETWSLDIGIASDEWAAEEEGRMLSLFRAAGVNHQEWNLEEAPYPLPSAHFDAVIMTEVFEHLRDYPIRSLEETKRVLRPGGHLFFTTPNAAYLLNRVRALRGESTGSSLRDWMYGVPHARHAREYTFGEIHSILNEVGLRIERSESRHFHVRAGRRGAVNLAVKYGMDLIARKRPTLGPQIVVVACADSFGTKP